MLRTLWKSLVFPKLVRPYLREHGLRLPAHDLAIFAERLEIERHGSPVRPVTVQRAWEACVAEPIIDALGNAIK